MSDSTMHTLVHSAITAARELGIERLILAATPPCPDPSSLFSLVCAAHGFQGWWCRPAPIQIYRHPKMGTTLRRRTNALSMAIGLADITREVHNLNNFTPAG
jgi:phosphatidylglycerol lysyltransferase